MKIQIYLYSDSYENIKRVFLNDSQHFLHLSIHLEKLTTDFFFMILNVSELFFSIYSEEEKFQNCEQNCVPKLNLKTLVY